MDALIPLFIYLILVTHFESGQMYGLNFLGKKKDK